MYTLPHHLVPMRVIQIQWVAAVSHKQVASFPGFPASFSGHRMKLESLGTRLARVYAGWISDQCGAPH